MIAVHAVGGRGGRREGETAPHATLDFVAKAGRGPAVAQHQMLEAGAVAMLAQSVRVAEDLRHRAGHRQQVVRRDENAEGKG